MSQTTQARNKALVAQTEEAAFPRLTSAELALVRPLAKPCDYADGDVVFRAGQPDIDLYVVESGQMEIRYPTDGRLIAVFEPGNFSGDIDMLTGRPVIAMAVARGPTRLLCVPNEQIRSFINRVPSLGEKLILAFTRRREVLAQLGELGPRVFGPGRCRATSTVREFL
jgi:thioredoxin reductase (NADPH)